jgi:magnesium-protoporphyrin O-methyltransferase
MKCCQCQGIETLFNKKRVAKELKRYRKKGPDKTTRILLDALKEKGIEGMTLLEVGGGIGVVQHELLQAGATGAVNVDASRAYMESAKAEAERQGHAARIRHHHGDFVDLAPDILPADVVILNRVICCYHDMRSQVRLSSARAQKLYGLVYPRDTWFAKMAASIVNLVFRVRRNPFRVFIHSTDAVDAVVRRNGLARCFYRKTAIWQVVVYAANTL